MFVAARTATETEQSSIHVENYYNSQRTVKDSMQITISENPARKQPRRPKTNQAKLRLKFDDNTIKKKT